MDRCRYSSVDDVAAAHADQVRLLSPVLPASSPTRERQTQTKLHPCQDTYGSRPKPNTRQRQRTDIGGMTFTVYDEKRKGRIRTGPSGPYPGVVGDELGLLRQRPILPLAACLREYPSVSLCLAGSLSLGSLSPSCLYSLCLMPFPLPLPLSLPLPLPPLSPSLVSFPL